MVVPWQVMTRASAQAGNRASKTEHYLQWWEYSPEWVAVTPAAQNRHNSSFIIIPAVARTASAAGGLLCYKMALGSEFDGPVAAASKR